MRQVPDRRRASRRCGSLASSGLPDLRARARHHPVVGGTAADQVIDRARGRPLLRRDVPAQRIELRHLRQRRRRCSASCGIRSSISAELRPCAASVRRAISWLRLVLRSQRHHLDGDDAVGGRHGSGAWRSSRNSGGRRGSNRPIGRVDVGVDAAGVGLERPARLGRQRRQRALGVAVEVERAQEYVGGEGALAEHLRQAALAGAALQLHLPQPVLRVHEARARERGPRCDLAKMCGTPSRSRTTSTGADRPAIASAPESEGTVFLSAT